jgi:hypothetical protein
LYTIDSLSLTLEGDVHQMQRVRNPDLWLPAQLHITKGKGNQWCTIPQKGVSCFVPVQGHPMTSTPTVESIS